MVSEEKLEAEVAEYKAYEVQIDAIQKQIGLIDETIIVTRDSIEALQTIHASSEGTEILLPIGAGIEMPVKLQGDERIILDIGSGVAIEYTPDKAAEILEDKLKELEDTKERLQAKINELSQKAAELGEKIEKEYIEYLSQNKQ